MKRNMEDSKRRLGTTSRSLQQQVRFLRRAPHSVSSPIRSPQCRVGRAQHGCDACLLSLQHTEGR